jgi:CBS domain-containing protein
MTIQSILNQKGSSVFTIEPSVTIKTAADHMRDRGVASLVVKSGNAITGILSERDVVGAISRFGERAPSDPVKGVLSNVITVAPGDSVKRAMRLMTHHRVRHPERWLNCFLKNRWK